MRTLPMSSSLGRKDRTLVVELPSGEGCKGEIERDRGQSRNCHFRAWRSGGNRINGIFNEGSEIMRFRGRPVWSSFCHVSDLLYNTSCAVKSLSLRALLLRFRRRPLLCEKSFLADVGGRRAVASLSARERDRIRYGRRTTKKESPTRRERRGPPFCSLGRGHSPSRQYWGAFGLLYRERRSHTCTRAHVVWGGEKMGGGNALLHFLHKGTSFVVSPPTLPIPSVCPLGLRAFSLIRSHA